jgi:hypothetical protein
MNYIIRAPTKIPLVVAVAALIWLNSAESPLIQDFGVIPPPHLGFIGSYLFLHGWPVPPFVFCFYHGNRFHPEETPGCWLALVFDALVAFFTLVAVAVLMHWSLGEKGKLHWTTKAALTVVTGALLWANTREQAPISQGEIEWLREYTGLHRYLLAHGWSLSPFRSGIWSGWRVWRLMLLSHSTWWLPLPLCRNSLLDKPPKRRRHCRR